MPDYWFLKRNTVSSIVVDCIYRRIFDLDICSCGHHVHLWHYSKFCWRRGDRPIIEFRYLWLVSYYLIFSILSLFNMYICIFSIFYHLQIYLPALSLSCSLCTKKSNKKELRKWMEEESEEVKLIFSNRKPKLMIDFITICSRLSKYMPWRLILI